MLYSVYVVNKTGGLIYQHDSKELQGLNVGPKKTTNDHLRLASTFYTLRDISTQIAPVFSKIGIETLNADTFKLHCFKSATGTTFFIVAAPGVSGLPGILKKVYTIYADFALKNPFYKMEQPIRHDSLFGIKIGQLLNEYNGE